MDDRARGAYRSMAYGFLGIGAVFVIVALLERLIGFDFFNASPVRVALLLIAIGGLLLWTVRERPDVDPRRRDGGDGPTGRDETAAESDGSDRGGT